MLKSILDMSSRELKELTDEYTLIHIKEHEPPHCNEFKIERKCIWINYDESHLLNRAALLHSVENLHRIIEHHTNELALAEIRLRLFEHQLKYLDQDK